MGADHDLQIVAEAQKEGKPPALSTTTSNVASSSAAAANTPSRTSTIARTRPKGAKTGYRSIEYLLLSSKCIENRHLRRLTGGGAHGPHRPLYEGNFSSSSDDNSTAGASITNTGTAENTTAIDDMEPWAEQFMHMLLYDERFSNLACKGQKLKKDLVDSVSIVERVEEVLVLARRASSKGCNNAGIDAKTGKGLLFFDMCSGKGITGLMLAIRYPQAKILCVDVRPPNPNEFHLLDGTFDNLARITGDVYDNEVLRNITNQTPRDGTCILLGTHLCGDLSRVAIDAIARFPDTISAAIVAPCCLPRQKKTAKLKKMPCGGWGYDTNKMARERGVNSFQLWLDRLLGRAAVADDNKYIVVDSDMLTDKNSFIVVHNWASRQAEEPLLCKEVGDCIEQVKSMKL